MTIKSSVFTEIRIIFVMQCANKCLSVGTDEEEVVVVGGGGVGVVEMVGNKSGVLD